MLRIDRLRIALGVLEGYSTRPEIEMVKILIESSIKSEKYSIQHDTEKEVDRVYECKGAGLGTQWGDNDEILDLRTRMEIKEGIISPEDAGRIK